MKFITRAYLYIVRHKLKSCILFATLAIISTFILTGIALNRAVNHEASQVRESVGGTMTLDLDLSPENFGPQEQTEGGNFSRTYKGDPITEETIQAILEVPGVIDHNISGSFLSVAGINFDFLPSDWNTNFDTTPYGETVFTQTTLNSERFSGFANGNLRLESGRHLKDDDYRAVLISDELAEHNNLDVGDTLELYVDFAGAFPSQKIEVEIIGIFSGTRGTGGESITQATVPGNQIIIDFATTMEINENTVPDSGIPGALTIYVEDPARIQDVYDEIRSLPEIDGKTFTLNMGTENFDAIAAPLDSLQGLVYTLIVIIILVSMAILALLLTMWTRGRVKEMGILLANGIKKIEIMSQLMLEVLVLAVIAIVLSLPISYVVAEGAGEFIVTQFTDAQGLGSSGNDDMENGFVFDMSMFDGLSSEPSFENVTNQMEIVVHTQDLIWVYAIALPIVMGAVFIASNSVMKLKPKEILSKMS